MTGGAGPDLLELRARVAAGRSLPSTVGLPAPLRRRLELAERLGAPLLPELDLALDDAAGDAELAAEVRVATAQARAVTTGLVVAPVLVVPALAALLDVDLVGFYLSAAGRVVLAVASVLHAFGVTWVRLAVARVSRRAAAPAVGSLDDPELGRLIGVGLRAGLDVVASLRAVADVRPDVADPVRRVALALDLGTELPVAVAGSRTARTLHVGAGLGAPAAEVVLRLSADLIRDHRTEAREAAARLPAVLTLPTALLVLPATLALVGAPLLAEALTSLGA